MTVRGVLCVLADACLLILALGSGIRELLVAGFCLGAFIAFSLLSLLAVSMTMQVEGRLSDDTCQRGDEVGYLLTLHGFLLLPVVGHLIVSSPGADAFTRKRQRRHAFSLLPMRRLKRQYRFELVCPHRGCFNVQPDSLQVQDLFGLFSVDFTRGRKAKRISGYLTVRPRAHVLEKMQEQIITPGRLASARVRDALDGELLGDTHLYSPGDSLKRIHWKQSARMQQLYSRQFESQEDARVLVLLDSGCRSVRQADAEDILIESAFSLVKAFVEMRQSVRLRAVGSQNAQRSLHEVLHQSHEVEKLANRLAEETCVHREEALEWQQLQDENIYSASTIFVVTDNPSESLLEALADLQQQGRAVGCVAVQPDEALTDTVSSALDGRALPPTVLRTVDDIAGKVGDVG